MINKRSVLLFAPYLVALAVLLFAAWTVWLIFLNPLPVTQSLFETLATWFDRLSPVLIGLIFWLPGILVLAFSHHLRRAVYFYIFCQAMCITLLTGVLAELGYPWGQILYWICLVWTGPIAVQAILALLFPSSPPRAVLLLRIVYGVAGMLTILYTAGKLLPLGPFSLYPMALGGLWLAGNLVLVFFILVSAYGLSQSLATRRKAGALLLSSLIGFSPFLLFALLPDALFNHPILPYEATYLFFAAIPAGYGYAILRYRLVRLERTIDRTAAVALVSMIVAAVYGICYLAFSRWLPNVTRLPLIVEMILAVSLIFAVQPLYQILQRVANRFIYGAWYDDRAALGQIGRSVSLAQGDLQAVASTLCQVLEKTIPLEYAHLMLPQGVIVGSRRHDTLVQVSPEKTIQLIDRLVALSLQEIGHVQSLEPFAVLNRDEQRLLLGAKPALWMVLRGSDSLLGLLIIGPRRGGEFDQASLETLELLTRQAKMALENAHLLAQVRANSEQITRLHHQLLAGREAERKGLAREIHDQTIQSLYGTIYHIARLKAQAPGEFEGELEELRQELTEVLGGLRRMCADLRPPSLDTLGIVPALRGLVRKMRKTTGLGIEFSFVGDEEQAAPENVSLALYRILQESLANAAKHAGSAQVQVKLIIDAQSACLIVQDNGKGVTLPSRLKSLADAGHYGLAGIQERVELAGGALEVNSAPGQGFRLMVNLPLEPLYQRQALSIN